MVEASATFLCKIASTLSLEKNTHALLRSYYLMQCKKIARNINLPERQFSSLTRCSRCCLEWKPGSEVNHKPIKLTKRQRQRIKRLKQCNLDKYRKKEILLHSNKLEQICSFCGFSTVTHIKKPDRSFTKVKSVASEEIQENLKNSKKLLKSNTKDKEAKHIHNDNLSKNKNNLEVNLYANAHDIFALSNNANTLQNKIKEPPKLIKNNKRKKDKYAGLCQKAVLAAAKLKEGQKKHNKLNLFLKPST